MARKLIWAIVLAVVLVAAAAGSFYAWKYFSAYESTDDAEVDGHINAISARISGYVLDVPVENERYVKAGDVLARIDPRDHSIALANAHADLAAAEAAFLSSRTDVPITSTPTSSQLKNARSGRADGEAALLGAQRQLSAAQSRLDTADAQVREAQSTYKNTVDDVTRYKLLIAKERFPSSGTIPPSLCPTLQGRPSTLGEPLW
jgi:membrane fusion protein (multidrug efflux system)